MVAHAEPRTCKKNCPGTCNKSACANGHDIRKVLEDGTPNPNVYYHPKSGARQCRACMYNEIYSWRQRNAAHFSFYRHVQYIKRRYGPERAQQEEARYLHLLRKSDKEPQRKAA